MSVMRPDGTPMSSDNRLAESRRAASSRFRRRPGCETGVMSPSMIVDDFNVECVAFAEFETDAPAVVHGHRPLIPAVALQLVQPNALERAQVLQRLGDVERQQKIDRRFEIQSPKLVRVLAFPNLPGRRVAPRA